jgi:TFIIF-interacting CTD phosphatase-like protein
MISKKKIHLEGNDLFQWQRSFHDSILRNDKSYQDIFNYKNQNPEKWIEDTI